VLDRAAHESLRRQDVAFDAQRAHASRLISATKS
jgi:hypothetical protein